MFPRKTIVGLGEVLWDVFPDGAHFGGAPANFACCAAELGGNTVDVAVVSAVGRDDFGRQAIDLLRARGIDTDCVSHVDWPTGQVLVELDCKGHASFRIAEGAAWDSIVWSEQLGKLATSCDAVCFGTLAQRSEVSRQTIQAFVRATRPDCLRILDINLRNPFWNNEILLQSLELAKVVKLNEAEMATVAQVLDWKVDDDVLLDRMLDQFSLNLVALTRGASGAVLVNSSGEHSDLPGRPVSVVDTVGAGDAYTAALAIGMLRGLPLEKINEWANRVAEFVCSQSGAAPKLPASLQQPSS
ncbi:MAG: carbohydrate kinase [Planctomycetes bacterium]|nr:carbohydrate kinase [Planctomycetota bacterium]